jgi:sulfate adenylyltransferase subunit 2
MEKYTLSNLQILEAEGIHIIREAAAEFERPVMLYSAGKDSSVLLRLARKAFHPGRIPFTLLHVDTGMKFPEMYEFRDRAAAEAGVELCVYSNGSAIAAGADPQRLGIARCCEMLKTRSLVEAIRSGGYDAAIGGARREEERSRAKERIWSLRDADGQWSPKSQRAELWDLYNGRLGPGETMRVFPLSNWTELDVWLYIHIEKIPVVPLYFAAKRNVISRGGQLIPLGPRVQAQPGEKTRTLTVRFRTLGCYPCTGAVRSTAKTVIDVIRETAAARQSERVTRLIDHDVDGSMERKKLEGYF